MTKREAKRIVREHAAMLIKSAIDNGDDGLFLGDDDEPRSEADHARIVDAVNEVAADILGPRRSGR